MYELALSFLFLCGITACGVGHVRAWRYWSAVPRIGAAMSLGLFWYVLVARYVIPANPWLAMAIAVLLSAVAGEVIRRIPGDVRATERDHEGENTSVHELVVLAVIVLMYLVFGLRTIGYDDIVHFNYAGQVARGKCPPSVFAFPEVEAKYHYGFGVLLGSMCAATEVSMPLGVDFLTAYAVAATGLLLLGLGQQWSLRPTSRILTLVLFFGGGGFLVLPHLVHRSFWRSGAGSLPIFQNHGWIFGYTFFLLLIYSLATTHARGGLTTLRWSLFLLPLVVILPVANGTSVPLLLLTIGILGLASMGRSTSWLQVAVRAVVTGVVIVACVLLVTRMGGVFARGADYGRDGFHLSITSYGIKNYLVFIAGYLLLMAPVGVVGVWLAIRQVWMRRWRLFELDHGMLVTLAACLVLYPLPLLLSLQRSVWNDFSKFNYFGVLASWILIGWCWDRATRSILKVGWGRAFAVALLVLVCSETGLNWMHGVWDDEQQQYLASVDARSELRQTLIRDIPIDAQVVLVTKRLDGYYEWSEGDFPRLYRFLRDNYGDFTTSIKESGASVPNYFSFTLSYNPARERQLWEVLDGLHRGRPEKLGDWNIAYVLFNVGDAPQYVEALLRSGKLQVVAESSSEGWQLCRVERCKSEMPTADQKDRGVSPQLVGGLP